MRLPGAAVPMVVASVLAGLLAAPAHRPQESGTYTGHFTIGFESSEFVPCAPEYADERWWLTADSASHATLGRGAGRMTDDTGGYRYRTTFVRLRGSVTDTGRYGHLGAYDRRLTVDSVLAVAHPDSARCPGEPDSGRPGGARLRGDVPHNISPPGRYSFPSP